MKKKYESPALYAEVFVADQTVAGNCTPGIKEEEVAPISVKCEPTSDLWSFILGIFGLWHDHGLGVSGDSKECIRTANNTIFAVSGCDVQVGEGDLRQYNGESYIVASWDSNSSRGKHSALYDNGSSSKPTYWNS